MSSNVSTPAAQDPAEALQDLMTARERLAEMRRSLDVAEAATRRLTLGTRTGTVAGCITSATPDFRKLRAHYDEMDAMIDAGVRMLESVGVRAARAGDLSDGPDRPADARR
ncbi:hypothetical protein [Salinarimonas ramus]|uniref:Uncharacterized protein n=1 Tax=Salinarimonas ramus TaxID=690164 RepID=A0A917QBY8_9HYPH|nr:hypothetical protein [Salinarimonas ramus]GGK39662.1 hypothetical protein GCM10011322_28500 [Salinarimonas ramus]